MKPSIQVKLSPLTPHSSMPATQSLQRRKNSRFVFEFKITEARIRTGAVPCMSRRPPAAAPVAVAPDPAAVAPEVGGTAVEGGSAAEAAVLAVVVVGAPVTGVQPVTAARVGSAFLRASADVKGWMISVNTLLLEAAQHKRGSLLDSCSKELHVLTVEI